LTIKVKEATFNQKKKLIKGVRMIIINHGMTEESKMKIIIKMIIQSISIKSIKVIIKEDDKGIGMNRKM
jgi:hypothetical protein